jgi:hypothetical protein
MKKSFMGSLICHNGIVGGGIYIDDSAITYKTNKLTVDKKYKNLVLSLNEIRELTWNWIVFPIAIIKMASGEQYKFIIFNKNRFNKYYIEAKKF